MSSDGESSASFSSSGSRSKLSEIVRNKGNGADICACPSSLSTISETVHYTQCPVCLSRFDIELLVPIGLRCGHVFCKGCFIRLYPHAIRDVGNIDFHYGLPNLAILAYLGYNVEQSTIFPDAHFDPQRTYQFPHLPTDLIACMWKLVDIARQVKGHNLSRAIYRKVVILLMSIHPCGENKVLKAAKAVGERALTELTSSCNQLSHYQAQQQLWAAIRARACQFMGPAMQEEALKLVLLALEDGSALSRKVLVMFVVQRLTPQFPQASKTSIGHVIQLLYRASCFEVTKRPEASSLMTLKPDFRNYDALRREHDAQIVRIALESGIRFSPEQWSNILYGDTSQKPHMQSIIDKIQMPQSFGQMTIEFLVSIRRLSDSNDYKFLLSIYPHFKCLATLDLQDDTQKLSWSCVHTILKSVHQVLFGLLLFNPVGKAKQRKPNHNKAQSQLSSSQNKTLPKYPSCPVGSTVLEGQECDSASSASTSNSAIGSSGIPLPQSFALCKNSVLSDQVNHGSSGRNNDGNYNDFHNPVGPPGLHFYSSQYTMSCAPQSGTYPISGTYYNHANSSPVNYNNSLAKDKQIWQLLAESHMLQERMKSLQTKVSDHEARRVQNEVTSLEVEATRMLQNVKL